MTWRSDEVVTAVALAEAMGWPDDELRTMAEELKCGALPTERQRQLVCRVAASYCAVQRHFGRAHAVRIVEQVFGQPEQSALVRALQQVSPCIVPVQLD